MLSLVLFRFCFEYSCSICIHKDTDISYLAFFRGTQPLVIVYQNAAQRERMRRLSKNVVFLDATYKGIYLFTLYESAS